MHVPTDTHAVRNSPLLNLQRDEPPFFVSCEGVCRLERASQKHVRRKVRGMQVLPRYCPYFLLPSFCMISTQGRMRKKQTEGKSRPAALSHFGSHFQAGMRSVCRECLPRETHGQRLNKGHATSRSTFLTQRPATPLKHCCCQHQYNCPAGMTVVTRRLVIPCRA